MKCIGIEDFAVMPKEYCPGWLRLFVCRAPDRDDFKVGIITNFKSGKVAWVYPKGDTFAKKVIIELSKEKEIT